mgnify:CR=1 FL=1
MNSKKKNLTKDKKVNKKNINKGFSLGKVMKLDNCFNLDNLKKINDNKIFRMIVIGLISFSISLLSLYLMIGKVTDILKYITLIVSFLCSYVYLYKNYDNIIDLIRDNRSCSIISFVLSLIIFYESTINPFMNEVIDRFFNISEFYYLVFPGLSLVFIIFSIYIKNWFYKFIKEMDSFERKAYVISSIVLLIILTVTYLNTDHFYTQFDRVYSIDSGLVYEGYFPDTHYYSIKHPLTSILNFPMYAITHFMFSPIFMALLLQYINIQLLIFIGLELKRLTNNKWVYIFYMLSFSTMLYSLYFEKYVLIVFFMVSYLYNVFIEKKEGNTLLIFSIGLMPTNLFIAVTEFFKGKKFKKLILDISKIFLLAILIFIVTGRIHCIPNGLNELSLERGSETNFFPISKNVNAATKMVEHSFIAIPSSMQTFKNIPSGFYYQGYFWNNIEGSISFVGTVVIIIILFGLIDIIKNKRKVYYSFLSGFIFSLLLFIIFTSMIFALSTATSAPPTVLAAVPILPIN